MVGHSSPTRRPERPRSAKPLLRKVKDHLNGHPGSYAGSMRAADDLRDASCARRRGRHGAVGGAVALLTTLVLGLSSSRADPPSDSSGLDLILVGAEEGMLVPGHGGEGLAGRFARVGPSEAAGIAMRVLAVGSSIGPTTPSARRLSADHLRAALAAERAIGHVLSGWDLDEPALAQGYRGEGPLGEPTPPLNVLPAPTHPAAGRSGFLDVEVNGIAIRAFSLVGERLAAPLRERGVARAWIAPATALQGLSPASDRVWLAIVDPDVDVSAVAPALARLSPAAAIVVRGVREPIAAEKRDGVAIASLVVGGRSAVRILVRRAGGGLSIDARDDGKPVARVAIRSGLDAVLAARLCAPTIANEVERLGSTGARYVGDTACIACHEALHGDPLVAAHARAADGTDATAFLADPACATCHATGYEAGAFPPRRHEDGFRDPVSTPWLAGVRCEACHGPGGSHLLDPRGKGTILPGDAGSCGACHDPRVAPGLGTPAPGDGGFHAAVPRTGRTIVPATWIERLRAAGRWDR